MLIIKNIPSQSALAGRHVDSLDNIEVRSSPDGGGVTRISKGHQSKSWSSRGHSPGDGSSLTTTMVSWLADILLVLARLPPRNPRVPINVVFEVPCQVAPAYPPRSFLPLPPGPG